jgi:hypothetical protein
MAIKRLMKRAHCEGKSKERVRNHDNVALIKLIMLACFFSHPLVPSWAAMKHSLE